MYLLDNWSFHVNPHKISYKMLVDKEFEQSYLLDSDNSEKNCYRSLTDSLQPDKSHSRLSKAALAGKILQGVA